MENSNTAQRELAARAVVSRKKESVTAQSRIEKVRGALMGVWLPLIEAGKQIVRANMITFRALWELQRAATVARLVVVLTAILAPILGWVGSARMIEAISGGGSGWSAVIGALALTGSLTILGLIPIALSSLERMSDNCTFEHVFGKFTRKLVTFTSEHLGDPKLSEKVKQVRERAVWRMMAMAKGQSQLVRNFGMLMVTGVTVALKAPELLPVIGFFGVPSMYVELRHARRRSDMEEALSPQWNGLWADLANLVVSAAISMLHQFGAAMWFAGRYRKGLADASREECQLESSAAMTRVIFALVGGCGLAISIFWLLYCARSGAISAGDFVFTSGAISGLAGCLADFASLLGQQWSHSKSIIELDDLLRHPVSEEVSMRRVPFEQEYQISHNASAFAKSVESGCAEHLEFRDVWLRYGSAPAGQNAVHALNFTVKRGTVVAVVGPNGAGKSSSMAMMLRQYQPTRGKILLNGTPISDMTAEEFGRQVIMLPQQLRHFNLTVRELLNLGRGYSPASDAVLWAELERTGAAEFARKWKDGLDTLLGVHRGNAVEPSGGQLQRLLLAAVVIADRGLIVLDEPVSMVDPEAAKQFWDAVFAERTGRTVIFSTHHLGAVRRADNILFIEGGTLAAQGTHEQLMETSVQYRRLFEAQASDYR